MKRTVFFLASLFTTHAALACSCAPIAREDVIREADAVVEATVLDVDVSEMTQTAQIRVEKYIKGGGNYAVVVHSNAQSAACGVKLAAGQKGEFALYKKDDAYRINSCSQWALSGGNHAPER